MMRRQSNNHHTGESPTGIGCTIIIVAILIFIYFDLHPEGCNKLIDKIPSKEISK